MGGVLLVLFDSLMNFRLEYLYPVLMFIRSVYDSYKYQGFVSVKKEKKRFLINDHSFLKG